ncbi:hypothetical protein H2202_006398 [Exophiala xenobiotica]|nr:hypothetical protein H2202_006398 [Exophiala xenobiotica]KAK5405032.1 hypothetical protein LTR06_009299 [Exophiala xenobiotica]
MPIEKYSTSPDMKPIFSDQTDSGQLALGTKDQLSLCRLQYPPHREPSFEVAVETTFSIARLIRDLLKGMPEKTNRQPPRQLLLQAEELVNFRCPTEKLIGFSGDIGVGKSHTLESVMGIRGLAKSEANGTAVTPFAVEYAFQRLQQPENFLLECAFMDMEEVRHHIEGLLVDFRRFAFATAEELRHDREDLETDYEAAKIVFETAFGNMPDFDLGELEHDNDENSREEALDYIQDYVAALEFPETMQDDGSWRHECTDSDKCQVQLSLLDERGLWPFIKTLRISGDIGILSGGLRLGDYPGSRDTNVARVRATRRSMAKCDDTCLVAKIDRVVDDPVVPDFLGQLKQRADACGKDGFNATIICTRCAETSNQRSLERLANAADVRALKKELANVELNQDVMTVREYKKALKQTQLKLDTLLIQARNAKVTAALKRKYAPLYGTGELKVFCIDNLHFEDDESEEAAVLSGLPALRQHLEGLSAESLFKDKDAFIGKMLPALVGSFRTWMDSCRFKLERGDHLRLPKLDGLRVSIDAIVAWEGRMKHVFVEHITAPLAQATALICSRCTRVAREWEGWHWQTMRAFARKNGTHRTEKVGYRCWNRELLTCFTEVTDENWHKLAVQVQELVFGLDAMITEPWKAYVEKCRTLQAPANFLVSLSARHGLLRREVVYAQELYFKEMEKLKANANAAGPSSDIVDCMLATYDKMTRLSGKGVAKKQARTLLRRVSSNGFVEDYQSRLTKQFELIIENISQKLRSQVHSALMATKGDLTAIRRKDGPERLFKEFPHFRRECERIAAKIKKQEVEVEELAAEARNMAKEQYGYDGNAET